MCLCVCVWGGVYWDAVGVLLSEKVKQEEALGRLEGILGLMQEQHEEEEA